MYLTTVVIGMRSTAIYRKMIQYGCYDYFDWYDEDHCFNNVFDFDKFYPSLFPKNEIHDDICKSYSRDYEKNYCQNHCHFGSSSCRLRLLLLKKLYYLWVWQTGRLIARFILWLIQGSGLKFMTFAPLYILYIPRTCHNIGASNSQDIEYVSRLHASLW